MRFHIQKSVVSFTKKDLAIVTGLKLSRVKPVMSEEPTGDIWTRYLGGKRTVTRNDILLVLNKYKSTNQGARMYDGVKLALLYVLSHGFLGNQIARPMEAYYLNLVDSLEDFKAYPWGDVIWDELRSYMKQSCEALENCTGTRVTFPGCMIALQVWEFETFLSLLKAGLCKVIEGREDIMSRTLKWKFHKKPSLEVFCDLIFYNDKFEWAEIVPKEQELALIQEANTGDVDNLQNGSICAGRVETEELHKVKFEIVFQSYKSQ
ncbi:unnamed protein product [Cuscuta europaea]|uniref:DUF1985 domain-containing protein n=1 Tax=Cuscuta europaea TaxID=41803 RepID=A0A9P1A2W2_CUSEU|nr:unnamed protein product [Cuscuta europaea]